MIVEATGVPINYSSFLTQASPQQHTFPQLYQQPMQPVTTLNIGMLHSYFLH